MNEITPNGLNDANEVGIADLENTSDAISDVDAVPYIPPMDEQNAEEPIIDEQNNADEVGIADLENTSDANINDAGDAPYISITEEPNMEATTMEPPSEAPAFYNPNTDMSIVEDDFKWYCLKTYNSYEERVKKTLESEAKRLGLGYCIREVVVPLETVFEVRKGKKKTKLRNFLAGYVLVNAAISEQKKTKKKIIDLVTDMTGVVSFVGRRNDPAALQPIEVERIFSRINERAEVATIDALFRKGDPVAVLQGPFSGFKGTVIDVANEKQKVKVEITILGRKTPIELSFEQVQFDKPV